MTTREIEALLEAYFEGITSLAEEKLLHEFFQTSEVPDHLLKYKDIFNWYDETRTAMITSAQFDGNTRELLVMEEVTSRSVKPLFKGRRLFLSIAFAASVVLLLGLAMTWLVDLRRHNVTDNAMSAEMAYARTYKALAIVSGNFNYGIRQASRLQMIDQTVTKIQIFNKFFQYQSIVIYPDDLPSSSIKLK